MHITTISILPSTGFRFTALTPPERSSSDDGYAAQKSSRFSAPKNPAWSAKHSSMRATL
jgi:hypothetical protein